jgi:hypothetical protein
MAVTVIGLDTAKHVFQVHGADESGRTVVRKRLRRAQVSGFFANLPKCVVGIEATQGAHYWSRVIGSFGHEVRLVAPQFVKPYLHCDPVAAHTGNCFDPGRRACRAPSALPCPGSDREYPLDPLFHGLDALMALQGLGGWPATGRPLSRRAMTDWEPWDPRFVHPICG